MRHRLAVLRRRGLRRGRVLPARVRQRRLRGLPGFLLPHLQTVQFCFQAFRLRSVSLRLLQQRRLPLRGRAVGGDVLLVGDVRDVLLVRRHRLRLGTAPRTG